MVRNKNKITVDVFVTFVDNYVSIQDIIIKIRIKHKKYKYKTSNITNKTVC